MDTDLILFILAPIISIGILTFFYLRRTYKHSLFFEGLVSLIGGKVKKGFFQCIVKINGKYGKREVFAYLSPAGTGLVQRNVLIIKMRPLRSRITNKMFWRTILTFNENAYWENGWVVNCSKISNESNSKNNFIYIFDMLTDICKHIEQENITVQSYTLNIRNIVMSMIATNIGVLLLTIYLSFFRGGYSWDFFFKYILPFMAILITITCLIIVYMIVKRKK